MQDAEARDRVAKLEGLLEEVESLADPVAQAKATEAIQALVELYGAGLERIVSHLGERDVDGELAGALAGDELVSHLLLLHDLHPVPLAARVRGALEEVRPYLESHGGDVELLGVEAGVVQLRVQGSCSGCPSSAVTLKLAIEDAIHKAAPDVQEIRAQDASNQPPPLLELEINHAVPANGNGRAPAKRDWRSVEGVESLASGASELRQVGDEPVLFLKLTRSLYAYRPDCPACGASLAQAAVSSGCLECPACETPYDVRRAGRSMDGSDLHMAPVPLLHDANGAVKVALGVPA